jgi:hypothetical protein
MLALCRSVKEVTEKKGRWNRHQQRAAGIVERRRSIFTFVWAAQHFSCCLASQKELAPLLYYLCSMAITHPKPKLPPELPHPA